MAENETNKLRPQVRVEPADAAWIDEQVRKREAVVGRRKVWGADVVHDLIEFYKSSNSIQPTQAASRVDPNHALLDLALSKSSREQQRAIVAWLRGKAGVMPEEDHEAETTPIRTESATDARPKTYSPKRAAKAG